MILPKDDRRPKVRVPDRVFPVELMIEIFRNPEPGLPWCWAVKEVAISGASVVLKRGTASRTTDAATDAQDALEVQEKAYR